MRPSLQQSREASEPKTHRETAEENVTLPPGSDTNNDEKGDADIGKEIDQRAGPARLDGRIGGVIVPTP